MNHYELMYILDPAVEEGLDEVKQKIEGIVTGREGVLISYDKLGKKRLAYPIAKRQYGVYYLVNLKGNGKIVQALDYFLRLSPIVLRHIILVFSDKHLRLRERTEAVLMEEAERMRLGGRPSSGKIEGEEGELLVDALAGMVPVESIVSDFILPDVEAQEFGEPPAAGEAVDELKEQNDGVNDG
jgi:small subunit ribosomal protein S6